MGNIIDREFKRLVDYISNSTEQEMLKELLHSFNSFLCDDIEKKSFDDIVDEFQHYDFFWGGIDPLNNNYERFNICIAAVKQNISEIEWLYDKLHDYRSKKVLIGILKCWLCLDYKYRKKVKEFNFDEYFDFDILDGITDEMVFVDCGSYDGDSAKSFIDNIGAYKRIYLYDMIPDNITKAKKNLCEYNNIIYRNAGVTSREKSGMRVSVNTHYSQAIMLHPESVSGNYEKKAYVPLVNLDEDICEEINMIKMDIEAAEIEAIEGAHDHITTDHPILAICTYHHFDHLWEIPRLICSLSDDYKLYMRYYGNLSDARTSEFTLFAV